ncbi:MAG: hypothetical protein OEQ39_20940 [Gammaproteobacteria bacterium]|nr:hypothetical protein [Gammaproteobacteria bacterium]
MATTDHEYLRNPSYSPSHVVISPYELDNSNERHMFVGEKNVDVLKIETSLKIVLLQRNGGLAGKLL